MTAMTNMFGGTTDGQGKTAWQFEDSPVKSVKKIGCKEDGKNAYLCDIEVEVAMAGNVAKQTDRARILKTDDGWALGGK